MPRRSARASAAASARSHVPSTAAPAPRSTSGDAPVGADISGCREKPLALAEDLEPGGAAAVAEQRAPGMFRGDLGDLAVRHAQQHDVDSVGVSPRPRAATDAGGARAPPPAPCRDGPRRQPRRSGLGGLFGSSSRIEIPARVHLSRGRMRRKDAVILPSPAVPWRHVQRFGAARGAEGGLPAGASCRNCPQLAATRTTSSSARATPTPT